MWEAGNACFSCLIKSWPQLLDVNVLKWLVDEDFFQSKFFKTLSELFFLMLIGLWSLYTRDFETDPLSGQKVILDNRIKSGLNRVANVSQTQTNNIVGEILAFQFNDFMNFNEGWRLLELGHNADENCVYRSISHDYLVRHECRLHNSWRRLANNWLWGHLFLFRGVLLCSLIPVIRSLPVFKLNLAQCSIYRLLNVCYKALAIRWLVTGFSAFAAGYRTLLETMTFFVTNIANLCFVAAGFNDNINFRFFFLLRILSLFALDSGWHRLDTNTFWPVCYLDLSLVLQHLII